MAKISIFVGAVVDVDPGKCIFFVFRIRLYDLVGDLTARIGQIRRNLTVASWLCLKSAVEISRCCRIACSTKGSYEVLGGC